MFDNDAIDGIIKKNDELQGLLEAINVLGSEIVELKRELIHKEYVIQKLREDLADAEERLKKW
jgi:septal ring factor EnvC (AmiA/AmiB activator)